MPQDNIKSAIEALLFASEKPLTLEQLRDALDNLNANEVRAKIEELKSDYEATSRGLRIVEVAGGYRMITASGFAPFLKKLFKDRLKERLSKPALETLAIIAYKQPLTRSEIELLRNVNVDGVMKTLLDKDLIRITGRKKVPGRPIVYGTTRIFLEHFGLKSLDELPKMEDFSKFAEKVEEAQIEPIEEGAAVDLQNAPAEELNETKESSEPAP
ncbi:MAG: SMC-Scp complex subunit ScpB [Candidatus Omnitrophica bacterium]|nr:SMC-Scp complex subunit ScpB [Candidatus Omnitrophota bacterium]